MEKNRAFQGARVLICGAFGPEIDLLRAELDGKEVDSRSSSFVLEIFPCGAGNTPAALNLQERILDDSSLPVSEVIFLGSAGIYPGSPETEDLPSLGTGAAYWNYELAVLEGRASLPEILPARIEPENGALGRFLAERLDARWGAVNSPDSITLTPVARSLFPESEFVYENMECFGLAFASRAKGVPFTSLLALTNRVGPDGSSEWARRHRAMGLSLQKNAIRAIRSFFE